MYLCIRCKQNYEESQMAVYKPSLSKGFCINCEGITSQEGISLQVKHGLMNEEEAELAIKVLRKNRLI